MSMYTTSFSVQNFTTAVHEDMFLKYLTHHSCTLAKNSSFYGERIYHMVRSWSWEGEKGVGGRCGLTGKKKKIKGIILPRPTKWPRFYLYSPEDCSVRRIEGKERTSSSRIGSADDIPSGAWRGGSPQTYTSLFPSPSTFGEDW